MNMPCREETCLVPGKGVEIHPEVLHVDLSMRSIGYSIHAEHCSRDGMDRLSNSFDVVDRSKHVAGMGARHEASAVSEQLFEIFRMQLWVLRVFGEPPFES